MITKLFKSQSLAIGFALFSMFFGAGNIIFPLSVGQYAGNKNFFAISGLLLTAAIMPIAGVIAMLLYEGNYRQFFGRLGKWPGFLLALLIISLLGPLGSTPRCIALSYTTLKSSFPALSPLVFSALSCCLIFLCTMRKNYIITLLGLVLTPLLICSLTSIIIIGLWNAQEISPTDLSQSNLFLHGLKERYNTMDLLAAFFFSSTILNALRMGLKKGDKNPVNYLDQALRASFIGALLLACVYIGFSYLAAFHGSNLNINNKEELLGAIAIKIAGNHAGILVTSTIALACLTTAIALITSFTDFIRYEVFKEKISYKFTLIGSLLLTFFVPTFEFTGISAFLGPILEICYPGLIALTFLNIAYKLINFKPVKLPVFSAFAFGLYFYF